MPTLIHWGLENVDIPILSFPYLIYLAQFYREMTSLTGGWPSSIAHITKIKCWFSSFKNKSFSINFHGDKFLCYYKLMDLNIFGMSQPTVFFLSMLKLSHLWPVGASSWLSNPSDKNLADFVGFLICMTRYSRFILHIFCPQRGVSFSGKGISRP